MCFDFSVFIKNSQSMRFILAANIVLQLASARRYLHDFTPAKMKIECGISTRGISRNCERHDTITITSICFKLHLISLSYLEIDESNSLPFLYKVPT